MSLYTPGPWKAEIGSNDWGMTTVHTIVPDDGNPFRFAFEDVIADIHSVRPYCAGASEQDIHKAARDKANAYLIAAAPELLENLEYRLSQIRCGCGHPYCSRCRDDKDTESAIAKAKGAMEKPT